MTDDPRTIQPAENMALTVALAQARRGDPIMPNVAAVLAYTLERVAAAYAKDQERGIVRVDTRDEAVMERITRLLFEHTTGDQHYRWEDRPHNTQQTWRSYAETFLAALRGETQP